jgi:hypothetical protein
MARASIALRVGAVKLTKMRGEFDLAKIRSSARGNPQAQTLEYKGFGREKAREMPCPAIRGGRESPNPPRADSVIRYD